MSKYGMVDNTTLVIGVAVLVIVITFKALRSSTMSDELVCRLIYEENEALARLWPVREDQNINKCTHHGIYIASYLNCIPQWVVNVLPAADTEIHHFGTLLS